PERLAERLFLALAEPRIGAVHQPDVARLHPAHRLEDAVADEVEERRDLAREVDADPQLLLGGEEARGQVRPVAERLGLLPNLGSGLPVDPGPVVERAVYGPDRDPQGFRDVPDPWRSLLRPAFFAGPLTHRPIPSDCAISLPSKVL